ncbi:unnamed protein product [Orchesella dallaii]|uniref:Spermatogenesis-associated protein 1 C-terminal domain-containing protein n=1 Tax=Orchesella dallaii TaxID=48710 RepID=A0ABP1PWG6_9HEXA
MNITIILPAVHVTSKRHRDESPQPTTPFPPISITPSPTPFSEASSYNPEDYKDLMEEYNREISDNHVMSKSRAEIVARQAAYDDIEIAASGSTTGTESGVPATPAAAPCPYCSSDSKSESSVRSFQKKAEKVTTSSASNEERRAVTETSLSTDRTESPSSVDTVNTVIQNKAYDVLGELKQSDIAVTSTLDDSFDFDGQEVEEELIKKEETFITTTTTHATSTVTTTKTTKTTQNTEEEQVLTTTLEDYKNLTQDPTQEEKLETIVHDESISNTLEKTVEAEEKAETKTLEKSPEVKQQVSEESTSKNLTQREEDSMKSVEKIEERSSSEEKEEKKVPVTEETGNGEVTIIVTQDEMPPANMFDSDEEDTGLIESTDNSQGQQENTKSLEKSTREKRELETESKSNHSDSKYDFYEEVITKEIHEDPIKNSDSSYFESHDFNETTESYYNLEKIEETFSHTYEEHSSDKCCDERSDETSEKSYQYEKDFENESGYEDFDRSFHENSGHFDSQYLQNEDAKIRRQQTLADIPSLPRKKSLGRKQITEDFTTATVPILKRKTKGYPDPRKPAVYPQRLNKTTLARQALAREKRRIYVEERIQNYMRNSKCIQTPYGSLDRSYSIDRTNNKLNASYSMSKTSIESKKYDKFHLSPSSMQNNHERVTQYRKSKMESPQSLPDISIIDYYMAPSRGVLTSTPMSSMGKISHHKSHLSNSMSSIRSPIAEVSVSNGGRSGGTPRGGAVIDSIPEETSDFWKAISSEEGYFYTFRVRQTGPVQMVDKGVQTQSGPMNFSKDFYTSYPRKRAPPLNNKSSTITLPLIDDRDKILREIAETVQLRHDAELRRAELIQRANDLQTLVKEKRDKINRRHEFWHKKYIEESSMTRPLEAACNSLRAELNTVHRRLLAHLEGRDLPLRLRDGPSKKANYKIMAARLQHEIKELQQKAKSAKLRLESEIKASFETLKEQAEREVRELRNDLAHKKVIMSLARSQIAGLPSVHPRAYELGY